MVAPSLEVADPAEAAALVEAAEAAGTPRWGRRSTISTAQQQAIRTRSASRPRWLPPWFPFLVVMLAAAAVVAATVDSQSNGSRSSVVNPIPVVAQQAAPTPTEVPTSIPTRAPAIASAVASPSPTLPPAQATPTQAQTRPPTATTAFQPPTRVSTVAVALPTARPSIPNPANLPTTAGPDGPIVAAYTTYATYAVQPGDTLNKVAGVFGVSGEVIMRTSGLSDPNLLQPGQVLTIPRDTGWLYRVQPTDTLDLIAVRFGVASDDLVAANSMDSAAVRPGELLFIPNRALVGSKQ
jgi:LysM repeat protein